MRHSILVLLFLPIAAFAKIISPEFFSPVGSENIIIFDSVFDTGLSSLRGLDTLGPEERENYADRQIRPMLNFLFGPGTYRTIGSPNRNDSIVVHWEQARVENGTVVLPYHYIGTWILDLSYAMRPRFSLPVPRNKELLYTPQWKRCTDSDPEHATEQFYWYFWDPSRPGCDHRQGIQYDDILVTVGVATKATALSYPEYNRMIVDNAGRPGLSLTVSFGYVEDANEPDPDHDRDLGAYEYRQFLAYARDTRFGFRESPILASEYGLVRGGNRVIGRRFSAVRYGVPTTMNVVMNAGVDQMQIFAKSFAHDHDALFAWLGHSRVGGGFDAVQFGKLLRARPDYYSVSTRYQMVYWGGCNSYSYYTLPFFKFKAGASGGLDLSGTKNLDILAHGLPSLFLINMSNASAVAGAVLEWPKRTSYQDIARGLEENGERAGIRLLAAVLGDEDNPK